ncbi:MAG: ImmA/IrrE family metallo-endopeptidase [Limnochordaceae bacterium]|nr:ImmA/IrrE family metallo-endopeptidase [Limnochordaceae bacterium]
MLGERLRLARKASGLSLRDLAQRVGVSAQAISKYERGLDVPGSAVLLKLAASLGVRPDYLLRPQPVIGVRPAFRSRPSRLSARALSHIMARVEEWVGRYLAAESFLPPAERVTFVRPALPDRAVQSLDAVERAAEQLRHQWSLGLDPIANLTAELEARGIRVGTIRADDAFDALTFSVDDGSPVIVVRDGMPGDRGRFSVAHELGHLVLEAQAVDPEDAANRFAAAFLVPAAVVRRELGQSRRRLSLQELVSLKVRYGLSVQAWIRRARDLDVITDSEYRRWMVALRSRGWHRQEPGPSLTPERPRRLTDLVYRLLSEGLVSESRAAELLGIRVIELRSQLRPANAPTHSVRG